jgi:Tol biopolymer transport system component
VFHTLVLLATSFGLAAADEPRDGTPEGRLLVLKEGKFVFLSPQGKQLAEVPGKADKVSLRDPALSPDGKRVAFVADEQPPIDRDGNYLRHVLVRNLDGKGEPVKIPLRAQNIAWTPDGKLLVVEAASFKEVRERKFTTWLVDPAKGDKTRVELPEGAQVFALTPDGKHFLASTYHTAKKTGHLSLITRDGKTVTPLTDAAQFPGSFAKPRLSSDGSKVLLLDVDPDADPKAMSGGPRFPKLFVLDVKTKTRERVSDVPQNAFVLAFAWSPDSKRLAYSWKRMEPGAPLAFNVDDLKNPKPPTQTESHLTVADASGKNAKTILSAKAPTSQAVTISDVDWR